MQWEQFLGNGAGTPVPEPLADFAPGHQPCSQLEAAPSSCPQLDGTFALWCKPLHLHSSTQGTWASKMHLVLLYRQMPEVHFLSHVLFSLTGYTVGGFFEKVPLHTLSHPSILCTCQAPHVLGVRFRPALAPWWDCSLWGSQCDLTLDTVIFLLLEKERLGY